MSWAVGGAIALHVALFVINFGFLAPAPVDATPQAQKVFVVQPVRFKPPRQEPQREIPRPREPRVPIPDPSPHDTEPLRIEEQIPQDFDLVDTDFIWDVPAAPPPIQEGAIRVGGDVTRPQKISGPHPVYTELARRARIQGVVIVEAIITKDGRVTDVRVLKPLPMGLDQSAVDAVEQWRFSPGTLNGKPVDVIYSLTVNFSLQ